MLIAKLTVDYPENDMYDAAVFVNDWELWRGQVSLRDRSIGWKEIVHELVTAAEKSKEPTCPDSEQA